MNVGYIRWEHWYIAIGACLLGAAMSFWGVVLIGLLLWMWYNGNKQK